MGFCLGGEWERADLLNDLPFPSFVSILSFRFKQVSSTTETFPTQQTQTKMAGWLNLDSGRMGGGGSGGGIINDLNVTPVSGRERARREGKGGEIEGSSERGVSASF